MHARIFDIQYMTSHDGPGLRTTFFFKGCNLRCRWCHNPESFSAKKQLLFYEDRCVHCNNCIEYCNKRLIDECVLCGECVDICRNQALSLVGKNYTVEQLFEIAKEDYNFYQNTGGITCSGGEAMLQSDFLVEFLKLCKENNINTAIDTAGNVAFSEFEKIKDYTDLFLYDVKHIDNAKHKEFTGAGCDLILDNLNKLVKTNEIWIRIPVIPGFNSNNIAEIKAALPKSDNIKKIELIDYHSMGQAKYKALGLPFETFKE